MKFSEPQPLPRPQPQKVVPERGPSTPQPTDPQTWINALGILAVPQGLTDQPSLLSWPLPDQTPSLPALWSISLAMPTALYPTQAQEEKVSAPAQTAETPPYQAAALSGHLLTLARRSRHPVAAHAQQNHYLLSLSARPPPSRTHWTRAPPMRPLSSLPPRSPSPHPPPLPELTLPMLHRARAPSTSTEASSRPHSPPHPPSHTPLTIPPLLITTPAPTIFLALHTARHHPRPTHAPKPFPLSRLRCATLRRRRTGTAY